MERKNWTPADLLQLSGSYWSVCALHAGVKLDVFTPLAEYQLTAAELSDKLKSDSRGLGMLLNSLVALGLLDKIGDIYSVTPFSSEYLVKTSPNYLGHIIKHHHYLMSGWAHLDQAVINGGPLRQSASHANDQDERESFLMGMFNLAMLLAPKVAQVVNLEKRSRLLDLGGGPGTYAIHFCRRNPQLTAVIYDLPTTRKFAEQTVTRFGLADRITFQEGDFDVDQISQRFDVAWLSHILHGEGPDGCAAILKKAVAALEPGGMIMVQEFILDNTLDAPLFPALFSLNMLLATPQGQAYSQGQLFEMLKLAGVRDISRIRIDLPNGAGVIAGTVG